MDQAMAMDGAAKTKEPLKLAPVIEESERNPIFDALITADGEVAGLVAYSLYKQNKRAWLDDFIKATGRTPTEAETRSYIIGESTERRLVIYRQLAAATLAEQGIRSSSPASRGRFGSMVIVLWVAVVVLAVAVIALALHGGGLAPSK
jgi:hypothetical protein